MDRLGTWEIPQLGIERERQHRRHHVDLLLGQHGAHGRERRDPDPLTPTKLAALCGDV
jgi:hypothetical protein